MYHSYPNKRQEFLPNFLYEILKLNVFSVDIPLKIECCEEGSSYLLVYVVHGSKR